MSFITFVSLIVITLLFWAIVGYFSLRATRLLIRFLRSRFFRYFVLAIGIIFVIRVGVVEDPFSEIVVINAGMIVGTVLAFFAFIVLAFMLYHGMKHGNPMIQDRPDPIEIKKIEVKQKKSRDWCPLCKEFTGCRIRRNPVTGMAVHVINGGSRPSRS